jgi:hypothetical protein
MASYMTAQQIKKVFGTTVASAKAMGVSRRTFAYWLKQGIPSRSQKLIEFETGGRFKADK